MRKERSVNHNYQMRRVCSERNGGRRDPMAAVVQKGGSPKGFSKGEAKGRKIRKDKVGGSMAHRFWQEE